MGFIQKFANTAAAMSRDGDFFEPGRGRVILEGATIFRGDGDPQTMKLSFRVIEAVQVGDKKPNAVGSTVVVIKKLNKKYEMGFAKTMICNILDIDENGDPAGIAKAFTEMFSIDPDTELTKDGAVCPYRGLELVYSTSQTRTKGGQYITVPKFIPIAYDSKAEFNAAIERNKVVLETRALKTAATATA